MQKCCITGEGGKGGQKDEGGIGEGAGRQGAPRDRLGRRFELSGQVGPRHNAYITLSNFTFEAHFQRKITSPQSFIFFNYDNSKVENLSYFSAISMLSHRSPA